MSKRLALAAIAIILAACAAPAADPTSPGDGSNPDIDATAHARSQTAVAATHVASETAQAEQHNLALTAEAEAVPTPTTAPQYEWVEEWGWAKGDFGSDILTGVIRNNSGHDWSYVQLEFNLYDADDNLVGSTLANTANWRSGESWRFEAPVIYSSATRARLVDITGY